jgi:chromosome partitioning protein
MTGSDLPAVGKIIVVANEKGGSGKSTVAVNIAVGLRRMGSSVAAVDLDWRQGTLTRYLQNRQKCATETGRELPMPDLASMAEADSLADQDQAVVSDALFDRLSGLARAHDFVLVDTPGHNHVLMAAVHAIADVLVTPMNDSLLDLDVLGVVNAETLAVERISHYGQFVRLARERRRELVGADMEWVVLRNRLSSLNSRNKRFVGDALQNLAARLGFRLIEGLADRVVFRELFLRGLTPLDDLDSRLLGARPTMSHVTSRLELEALLESIAPRRSEAIQLSDRDAA